MRTDRIRRWVLLVLPAVGLYGAVLVWNHPHRSLANAAHSADTLLEQALARCEALEDYRCVMTRQERVDGKLSARQTMRVLFRERPLSIYMEWLENVGRVRRALYVQGQHRRDGEEQMIVEPAGGLARLVTGTVPVPVHGEDAREASRRTIDEFGFRHALETILHENEQFARRGVLCWDPPAAGAVDNRQTIVLTRRLPCEGPDEPFPNAVLVIHLDEEWLLPVALRAYADKARRVLLEEYVFTSVELNPGLSDADFRL